MRSAEENVRPQFLPAHADFRAQDHSDLVGTGNSGSGFATASPVYHDTLRLTSSVEKFEPPRDLGVVKLGANDDPQDFNIALQISRIRTSRSKISPTSGTSGGSGLRAGSSSLSNISANSLVLSGATTV